MLKSSLTTKVVKKEKLDWNTPKLVQTGTTMLLTTGVNTDKDFTGVVVFCSNSNYSLGYFSNSFSKDIWEDVEQDVTIKFETTK